MPVLGPLSTTDPPPPLTLTTTTPPSPHPLHTTCPVLGSLPSRIPTGNTCCLWISQKHCKFFVIPSVRAFYKVASGNVASIHQPHPIPAPLSIPPSLYIHAINDTAIYRSHLSSSCGGGSNNMTFLFSSSPASLVRVCVAGLLQVVLILHLTLLILLFRQELSAQLVDCLHL